MTDADVFVKRILALEPEREAGNSEYGSRVMPVLELYKQLKTFEEWRAFQDALECLLTDPRERVREFAVAICLGFFILRDAI
jgi:hypothetical protein